MKTKTPPARRPARGVKPVRKTAPKPAAHVGAKAASGPALARAVAAGRRRSAADAPMPTPQFAAVEAALEDIRRGRMVIVVDDAERENEGDLIMAASKTTAADVNFMVTEARGLLCVGLSPERAEALDLFPMTAESTALHGTAFTVSVDASKGVTTGSSAPDRALTIRKLADPKATPGDFARPGHVFPLRAVRGGVLRRAGHTEASMDLVRLAGLGDVGVLCEMMAPDGSMARLPGLTRFAKRHGLRMLAIRDLIAYRRRHEKLVTRLVHTRLPGRREQ